MSLYRTVILSAMLTLLASLCSCSSDEPETRGEGDGKVQLVLNIITNNPTFDGLTRADEYSFEDPINEWECVKSMRVIIVRNDAGNIVEHNTPLDVPLNADPKMPVQNQIFEVAGGEEKGIWLIANEESLSEADQAIIDGMAVGTEFDASKLTGMTISTANNRVLYDNTGDSKTYLPLCEHFDVNVRAANPGTETTEQEATFFVTRAAVKYSFSIDPTSYVDPEAKNNPGYRISEITVTGLANKEFLFPNETVYSPAKETPLAAGETGRIITSYKCPDDITTGTYTFLPPETFGVNGKYAAGTGEGETGGTEVTTNRTGNWAPLLYFAESPLPTGDKGYQVTVKVLKDGDDEPFTFGPATLPNLSSLPRNTHVKLNFKFNPYGLTCTVTLVPYIGVWLYPDFGLDN